jgi:hypothetical protein
VLAKHGEGCEKTVSWAFKEEKVLSRREDTVLSSLPTLTLKGMRK